MKKTYLKLGNCFKNSGSPLISSVFRRGAAVLLSVSMLSYLAIPIGAVNAETPAGGNNAGDGAAYGSTVNKSTIYGDLNGDFNVNSLDLESMKILLLGFKDNINTAAADLNGDGNINALDLVLMKQFILGKIAGFPAADTFKNTTDGTVIDVNLDGSFKITLEENGSTGYLWDYTVSEENALNLVSEESFSFSPGMAGAPIEKEWTFKALKAGKYTLLYTYRRPWETGKEPLKTVKCDIYVSTTNGTVINVNKDENFKVSLKKGGFAGFTWSYSESEKNAFLLISENSYYQHPGVCDGFAQKVWTFKALKPGKYTLTFTREPGETTVQCEINVQ